jgi:hypothetical protein
MCLGGNFIDGINLTVSLPADLAFTTINVCMPLHILDTHLLIGIQGGFIHNIEHIVGYLSPP